MSHNFTVLSLELLCNDDVITIPYYVLLPADENTAGCHDNTVSDGCLVSTQFTLATLIDNIPYYYIIIL